MKGILLIIAVLFIVLISGCTLPSSEEMRAMGLAAQTTEGQIMTKIYEASNRFQYCTTQGIIDAMALLTQAQPTQEQLQQVYAQIEVMKKCIPRMNIQAKNVADGIYNVEYTFVLPETCANPQMRESFEMQDQPGLVIEANLNDNSTKVIKGKMTMDPAQIQTMFAQMESFGDCSLMLMTFAVFTSQSVTSEVQPERQQP